MRKITIKQVNCKNSLKEYNEYNVKNDDILTTLTFFITEHISLFCWFI